MERKRHTHVNTVALVNALILLLFLVSGAAAGWLGVDLLPDRLLLQVSNLDGLRWVLGGLWSPFWCCGRAVISAAAPKINESGAHYAYRFIN